MGTFQNHDLENRRNVRGIAVNCLPCCIPKRQREQLLDRFFRNLHLKLKIEVKKQHTDKQGFITLSELKKFLKSATCNDNNGRKPGNQKVATTDRHTSAESTRKGKY